MSRRFWRPALAVAFLTGVVFESFGIDAFKSTENLAIVAGVSVYMASLTVWLLWRVYG